MRLLILIPIATLVIDAAAYDIDRIEAAAIAASNAFDIDADLILAVIEVESGFNPRAIGGSHGEIGLMQLNPRYFKDASFDVFDNVIAGARHLAYVRSVCSLRSDGYEWVTCYNTGTGVKLRRPSEFVYYKKVMSAYTQRKQYRALASL